MCTNFRGLFGNIGKMEKNSRHERGLCAHLSENAYLQTKMPSLNARAKIPMADRDGQIVSEITAEWKKYDFFRICACFSAKP